MSLLTVSKIQKESGSTNIDVPSTGQWIDLASAAQGDVLYYNGTSYVRLAPGTSGQHLQTAGAGANPIWGEAGKVLQQLYTSQAVGVSTTSTSYITTGMSIAITPASTSSKFLLILAGGSAQAASGEQMRTTFFVDTGSGAAEVSPAGPYEQIRNNGGTGLNQPHSAICLHSPSTTNSTTYHVYYNVNNGTGVWSTGTMQTEFSVMEVSS